jgi:hypothetical protein
VGMHIDDAVDAFVRVLHLHPVDHRAEIVAERQVAGRLHAGKYTGGEGSGHRGGLSWWCEGVPRYRVQARRVQGCRR